MIIIYSASNSNKKKYKKLIFIIQITINLDHKISKNIFVQNVHVKISSSKTYTLKPLTYPVIFYVVIFCSVEIILLKARLPHMSMLIDFLSQYVVRYQPSSSTKFSRGQIFLLITQIYIILKHMCGVYQYIYIYIYIYVEELWI